MAQIWLYWCSPHGTFWFYIKLWPPPNPINGLINLHLIHPPSKSGPHPLPQFQEPLFTPLRPIFDSIIMKLWHLPPKSMALLICILSIQHEWSPIHPTPHFRNHSLRHCRYHSVHNYEHIGVAPRPNLIWYDAILSACRVIRSVPYLLIIDRLTWGNMGWLFETYIVGRQTPLGRQNWEECPFLPPRLQVHPKSRNES